MSLVGNQSKLRKYSPKNRDFLELKHARSLKVFRIILDFGTIFQLFMALFNPRSFSFLREEGEKNGIQVHKSDSKKSVEINVGTLSVSFHSSPFGMAGTIFLIICKIGSSKVCPRKVKVLYIFWKWTLNWPLFF